MEYGNREFSLKKLLFSTTLITVLMMACTVSLTAAIDVYCATDINHWQPIYPGAELVSTKGGFFRPRAMGLTESTYFTTDDVTTVRTWYREYRNEITRGAGSSASEAAAQGIATTAYLVTENPEGEGALIHYRSECAFN